VADWRRSTEELSCGDLPPDVQASVAEYAAGHGLGDVARDATVCAATTSERKALFRTRRQRTYVLVTPALLVWALAEGREVTTVGAKRDEVEIREFQSDLVADTGLEVFGFVPIGAAERGTAFVGLGPEPAAQRVRDALRG
jgi:hypothetical protein